MVEITFNKEAINGYQAGLINLRYFKVRNTLDYIAFENLSGMDERRIDQFTLKWVTGWFRLLGLFLFKRIRLDYDGEVPIGAILLLQNHFSWWDGYFAWLISKKLGKRFYVMMLKEQIDARPFLSKVGAFPVSPGRRSIIESFRHASRLLSDDNNLVTIFPEGEIKSIYKPQIKFKPGISLLSANYNHQYHILFSFVFVDYFSSPRPTVTIRLHWYDSNDFSVEALESAYNNEFVDMAKKQIQ